MTQLLLLCVIMGEKTELKTVWGSGDKINVEVYKEMKCSEGVARTGPAKVLLIVPALIALILQSRPH